MATYFLLLRLNQDGRNLMHEDPEVILHAAHSSNLPDVQCMGLYAVLGDYDFITVLEAPDNESAARFKPFQPSLYQDWINASSGLP